MPELLKGRPLKWFIANNKQWKTWAEFIDSFHTYFLPRDFFTRLCAVSSDDSHVVVMLVPPSSVFISPNKTSAGEQYHLYYKRIVTTN